MAGARLGLLQRQQGGRQGHGSVPLGAGTKAGARFSTYGKNQGSAPGKKLDSMRGEKQDSTQATS